VDVPLVFIGRRLEPVGDLIQLRHITDEQGRLLEFMVDSLDQALLIAAAGVPLLPAGLYGDFMV